VSAAIVAAAPGAPYAAISLLACIQMQPGSHEWWKRKPATE